MTLLLMQSLYVKPDGETVKGQMLLREIHRSQKALGKISLMDWVEDSNLPDWF